MKWRKRLFFVVIEHFSLLMQLFLEWHFQSNLTITSYENAMFPKDLPIMGPGLKIISAVQVATVFLELYLIYFNSPKK